MNTAVYIALLKNRHRIKYSRADGAAVSDQSTDKGVTRNPNHYLAPLAGSQLTHILITVMLVVIIILAITTIAKNLKS